jgi:hypothetical protein
VALDRLVRLAEAGQVSDRDVNRWKAVAEEIDPATGTFLGNMPQGLSHLALLNAAALLNERWCPGGTNPGALRGPPTRRRGTRWVRHPAGPQHPRPARGPDG